MSTLPSVNAIPQQGEIKKPVSAKKEFEHLVREIRTIAAKTRVFSGDLVQELLNETKVAANTQRNWSLAGSAAQVGIPLIAAAIWAASSGSNPQIVENIFQIGSKAGDAAHGACNATQYGYQATNQKIQQTISHYNAFDQRMQSLVQTLDGAQQRMQQQALEEASNR